MSSPTPSPAKIAVPVIPPHKDAGPLSPQKIRMARVRIALQELTALVEDLEDTPPEVRQAACQALGALLELQNQLQAQRGVETQESRHG